MKISLTKFRDTLNKVIAGYSWEDFVDDCTDVTGTLLSPFKKAMDTVNRSFYDLSGSDQTVVSYSNQFITATGAFTDSRKGDLIIFKTGVNAGIEVQIIKKVSNDLAIIVYTDLSISNGDTFRIWRSRVNTVDSSGNGSVSLAQPTKAPLAQVKLSLVGVDQTGYTELLASVGSTAVTQIQIFSNTGEAIYLAFGAAASEADKIIIKPGHDETFSMDIPASTRLSIKSVAAPAEAFVDEFIIVNLFG
jgi:hypothetical protein